MPDVMSEAVIKVEQLSKKYCRDLKRSLLYGLGDMGRELLGADGAYRENLRDKEFWALNDINFEVHKGECLGLIGRNGAGKSTLLKILNGLIKPDTGKVTIKGRVGALIELGAGFNPILTGRENVYVNGAVLGFSKKEIDAIFDEIVAFAELEDFIDSPVQYYSSGMKVRLGFAVASQMKPDVLLIDEVLAVGDIAFKTKCFNRISDILENTCVIFVSHSMSQIQKICSRALLLNKSEDIIDSVDVGNVINTYHSLFKGEKGKYHLSEVLTINKLSIAIEDRLIYDIPAVPENSNLETLNSLCTLHFNAQLDLQEDLILFFTIEDPEQQKSLQIFSPVFKSNLIYYRSELDFSELNTGRFTVSIHVSVVKGGQRKIMLFEHKNAFSFLINRPDSYGIAPILKQLK